MTGNIKIFKLVILLAWAVRSWYSFYWIFAGQQWPYLFPFNYFGQVTVILLILGIRSLGIKTLGHKKQSKPSVWYKIQEQHKGSGTSNFHWFNQEVSDSLPNLGFLKFFKTRLKFKNQCSRALLGLKITCCISLWKLAYGFQTIQNTFHLSLKWAKKDLFVFTEGQSLQVKIYIVKNYRGRTDL